MKDFKFTIFLVFVVIASIFTPWSGGSLFFSLLCFVLGMVCAYEIQKTRPQKKQNKLTVLELLEVVSVKTWIGDEKQENTKLRIEAGEDDMGLRWLYFTVTNNEGENVLRLHTKMRFQLW